MIIQFFEPIAQLPVKDMIIVWVIFMIGAPIMMINNILMFILDFIMPEGWNDE